MQPSLAASLGPEPSPRRLYHYTCSHSFDSIIADRGVLQPNRRAGEQPITSAYARRLGYTGPVTALPVIWLTDIDVRSDADADAIGLKGWFSPCDRIEYRFRVPPHPSIHWWPAWRRANEATLDPEFIKLLEYDCLPEHWWVSAQPVPGARLDERYRRP